VSAQTTIAPGGYAWWYFDALSDDGEHALAAIFFIGSVFSPSYAERLRRGEAARPEEHVAVNLALYRRGRNVGWVMSEYPAARLGAVDEAGPHIAGSCVERLPAGGLRLRFAERTAPFFAALAGVGLPVEGTVELEPLAPPFDAVALTAGDGRHHRWRVPVPRARARVRFSRPAFAFDGIGYHDVNEGDGRLEAAFSRWSWARFHRGDRTTVLYALRERHGAARAFVVDARDGDDARATREVRPGPDGASRPNGWGLRLPTRFDVVDGALGAEPLRPLETAPFYARYLARLSEGGRPVATGLGEYLDLDRFRGRGVQFLLRFKTRRVS
jgi:carotenoid 1,2-hydratase